MFNSKLNTEEDYLSMHEQQRRKWIEEQFNE
ncbi:hypothetical protein NVP1170O_007 [Vibrio phage 1.170.O._10N.261.52.C3]|nr:hypothetical protein NVP1170O_007 [Vibrio phage 1.170.O._10N.261.52.C3]